MARECENNHYGNEGNRERKGTLNWLSVFIFILYKKVKCYRYWPELEEEKAYGDSQLSVKNIKVGK